MTPEARRYFREAKAEAEEWFKVRSPEMLRAALSHPDAAPVLETFPELARLASPRAADQRELFPKG